MEKLEKALELRKAKYLKRTGSSGHYKYVYREKVERKKGIEKQVKRAYDSIFKETNNKFEAMILLDANGNTISKKLGKEASINLSSIAHLLKGAILLHNHPFGCSFSQDDVLCAVVQGLKEIRAVGNKYEYIYRPKEHIPRTRANEGKMSAISGFLHKENIAMFDKYEPVVKSGKMTIEDVQLNHHHEIMINFVKELGGFYERRER